MKPKVAIEIRFWKYIIKNDDINKCWKWTGSKIKSGYGNISVNDKIKLAHRVSYEMHNGAIPEGMFVCHSCDNPECCNPLHLWIGTNSDNVADKMKKGRLNPNDGMNNPRAILKDQDILEIRKLLLDGVKGAVIARQYGVGKTAICRIKLGKSWANI